MQHCVLVTFFVGWTFSQICRVTIIILSASKNVTQCSVEFDHLSRVKILSSIWSTVGPSTFKIYSENAQALQSKSTVKSYMGIVVLIFIDIDPCFFLRHIQTSKWAYIKMKLISERLNSLWKKRGLSTSKLVYHKHFSSIRPLKKLQLHVYILLFVLGQETYIWKRVASFLYYSFVQTLED